MVDNQPPTDTMTMKVKTETGFFDNKLRKTSTNSDEYEIESRKVLTVLGHSLTLFYDSKRILFGSILLVSSGCIVKEI